MPHSQADRPSRLQAVVAEARETLVALQTPLAAGHPFNAALAERLARWIESLEAIVAQSGDGEDAPELSVRGLLARAINGADIDVDGVDFSLHDITQLAAALRPGASLTVRNSECLSPIEQTSIWTVMPGQVRFV